MSQIKLLHSGGNGVILAAPDSNPASDRTLKLPGDADGTILTSNSSTGKVLNYSDVTKSDTQTTTSTSFVDITGLSVTLTPASTASKLLIMYSIYVSAYGPGVYANYLQLVKVVGGTASDIHRGDANGNRMRITAQHWTTNQSYDAYNGTTLSGQVIHAPSTTSAVTIKMQFKSNSSSHSAFINRMQTYSDSTSMGTCVSNISVVELGA